jgi:hypothetical protein
MYKVKKMRKFSKLSLTSQHYMNQPDSNPHLKRLDELEEARRKWAYSEQLLNILRSETGKPLKEVTDEDILQWHQQNLTQP